MAEIVFVKIWKRLLLCKIFGKLRAWEGRHRFCTFLLPMPQNILFVNLETRIVIILEGALNLRFEKQHFLLCACTCGFGVCGAILMCEGWRHCRNMLLCMALLSVWLSLSCSSVACDWICKVCTLLEHSSLLLHHCGFLVSIRFASIC